MALLGFVAAVTGRESACLRGNIKALWQMFPPQGLGQGKQPGCQVPAVSNPVSATTDVDGPFAYRVKQGIEYCKPSVQVF